MVADLQDPDLLHDFGHDVLAALNSYYAARFISLPDLQFVGGGALALDCSLLAVSPSRVYNGLPGAQQVETIRNTSTQTVEFEIWLIRGVPALNSFGEVAVPPTAQEMDDSGKEILRDWQLVRRCLVESALDGSLFPTLLSCRDLAINQQVPYGPSGKLGGVITSFGVQVL